MSQPTAPATSVRPLGPSDCRLVETFLDADPGYALFVRSNLTYLARGSDLAQYWGTFAGEALTAVAMDVDGRIALYSPPGGEVRSLAKVVAPAMRFTMGRPDLVEALIEAAPPESKARREDHLLAELTSPSSSTLPGGVTSPPGSLSHEEKMNPETPIAEEVRVVSPPGALIRRATLLDVPALTALYDGSAGFEQSDTDTVRRTIAGRVRTLRTYLAESHGRVVAAASSTAETPFAAMVGGVWTAPETRNQGFAGAVVAALSRDLVEAGMRPYLFYLESNAVAGRLYARVGYRVVGRWSVAYITAAAPRESLGTRGEAHV